MNSIQRGFYPEKWKDLARACKERANWQCEHCGIKQYSLVYSRAGTPYIVYLHAAHKYHDKQNPTPDLICLCIACHSRYDHQQKIREARVRLETLKHLLLLVEQGVVTVRCEGGW